MMEAIANDIILSFHEGRLENIQRNWNKLTNCLNKLSSYEEIESLSLVAEAMFLYGDKYSNKNPEEERVRTLTTAYILWLGLSNSLESERAKLAAMLLLYSEKKFKYLLPLFHYTLSKEESNYPPSALPKVSDEKAQKLQRNYDAIKLYLHKLICPYNHLLEPNILERIKKDWEKNKGNFDTLNTDEIVCTGDGLLKQACQRMIAYGKHPLQSVGELTTPFARLTRNLIKNKFVFHAESYLITERGHYSEGETQAILSFDVRDNCLVTNIDGINADFIRPNLSQQITHCVVDKLKYQVDLHLEHRSSLGDGENVPGSIDIFVVNNTVTQLRFFFIVGKEGRPRLIHFYGRGYFSC
ncbi:MAG: hypothetical protein K2M83_00150 [Muribaculaceae bacterium]|nr:hypothetical protein [Muribaculaceae bacterium]